MIDSVKVLKGYNEVIDNEAIRVLKTIPWNIVFKKGKHLRLQWPLPILFSEKNRRE